MPYKKTYKKKFYKKRSYKKRTYKKSIKQVVQSVINSNSETKLVSSSGTLTVSSAGAYSQIVAINQISQGAGQNSRVGMKCNNYGLYIDFVLQSTVADTSFFRFMVIKCPFGTFLTGADLLLNSSSIPYTPTAGAFADIQARNNKSMFTVLMDKVYKVSPVDVDRNDTVHIKKLFKLRGKAVYPGTTATDAMTDDNIRIFIWSRNIQDTSSLACEYNWRYYFKDE